MIEIDIIGKSNFLVQDEIRSIITKTLSKLQKQTKNKQIVEIKFVDSETVKKINYQYRKIDKPTDVISFPLSSIPGKNNLVGSIVISEEIMDKMGGSLEQTIKHGILHLVNLDHQTNQKAWNRSAKLIDHSMNE